MFGISHLPFRASGDEQGLTQLQSQLHALPAELCDSIVHTLHRSHLLDASSLHFLVHLHGLSVLDIRLLYLATLTIPPYFREGQKSKLFPSIVGILFGFALNICWPRQGNGNL